MSDIGFVASFFSREVSKSQELTSVVVDSLLADSGELVVSRDMSGTIREVTNIVKVPGTVAVAIKNTGEVTLTQGFNGSAVSANVVDNAGIFSAIATRLNNGKGQEN